MSENNQDKRTVDVVKNYTQTRRFPQVISKTHDGRAIPGGPYTYTQLIGGAVALFVLWKTMPLWSFWSPVVSWIIVISITIATVILLGRLPLSGRNPLSFVMGLSNATTKQAPDSVSGMRPKTARIKAVYSEVRIQTPLSPNSPARRPSQRISAPSAPTKPQRRPAPTTLPTPPAEPEILEHHPVRRPTQPASTTTRRTTTHAKSSVQSLLDMAQKGA